MNERQFTNVFVYLEEVHSDTLILQKEELDSVEWFDLEEVLREYKVHNQKFCVPVKGLEIAKPFHVIERGASTFFYDMKRSIHYSMMERMY